MSRRRERGRARRRIAATVAHALAFETWRSLARDGGLHDREAVALMIGAVAAAAHVDPSTVQRN